MDIKGLFFTEPLEANAFGHVIAEIYKDGIYYPYFLGKQDMVVIDAGANLGYFSYFAHRFAKKVYAIEPSKEHITVLKHMLAFNKITCVEPFQFALSIKDGEDELHHYSNKTMYSLYGSIEGTVEKTGKEKTMLKRLDTFFMEQNIEHVDFLKLDVEGVEFEILCGDSFAAVAEKIDTLVCEVHAYAGRPINQIVDALKSYGFTVEKIPNDAAIIIAKR